MQATALTATDAPSVEQLHRQISLVNDPTVWRSPEVRRVWRALLRRSVAPHAIHQSPEWFEHRLRSEPTGELFLAVLSDEYGVVAGASPIALEAREVDFSVGDVRLYSRRLETAVLLGGVPLLPNDARAHDELFTTLADELPQCDAVDLGLVPRSSFAYHHVRTSQKIRERFFIYEPEMPGAGPLHLLRMPPTFETYLGKFSGKTRSTLRRRVKLMREEGELELARYDAPGAGEPFLEAAAYVAQHSWQRKLGDRFETGTSWPARIVDMANHGLLRSFVLRHRGEPCAFVLGTQHDGVFHYAKPAFDERRAKDSPGTVLMYLILEHLFREDTPHTLCFCFGDVGYKRFFGNDEVDVTDVLLLRRSWANGLFMTCHAALRGTVAWLKRVLRRPLLRSAE